MFIALIVQKTEGCDYSIACGKNWIELQSDNEEAAINELYQIIIGRPNINYVSGFDGNFWGESKLAKAIILRVSKKMEIQVSNWYSNALAMKNQMDEEEATRVERVEYERLKAKFEHL